MPNGLHQLELDIPIENVWAFVSDMNKWAPLVPGYEDHTVRNEKQSTWAFIGDIGIMQKKVSLQIDITNRTKPTTITFDLTGINENFHGSGSFQARAINHKKTIISASIALTAKGMMGPVINPLLKSFVPKTTKDLTLAIAEKIKETEFITT